MKYIYREETEDGFPEESCFILMKKTKEGRFQIMGEVWEEEDAKLICDSLNKVEVS